MRTRELLSPPCVERPRQRMCAHARRHVRRHAFQIFMGHTADLSHRSFERLCASACKDVFAAEIKCRPMRARTYRCARLWPETRVKRRLSFHTMQYSTKHDCAHAQTHVCTRLGHAYAHVHAPVRTHVCTHVWAHQHRLCNPDGVPLSSHGLQNTFNRCGMDVWLAARVDMVLDTCFGVCLHTGISHDMPV